MTTVDDIPGARSRERRRRRSPVVAFLTLAMTGTACTADLRVEVANVAPTPTQVVTAAPIVTPPILEPTTEPVAEPTPSPEPAPSPPGATFDLQVPAGGERLGVIGVAHDETLEVRALPGTQRRVVARLGPRAANVVGTGQGRELGGSGWWLVRVGDVEGWVRSAFLARLGGLSDVTSEVVDELSEVPTAKTMAELGRIVARTRASTEPKSRITVTIAPSVGDIGEIVLDVVGLGDDAQTGERLRVVGAPARRGNGFFLRSVESRALCSRGVVDGLCG